MKVVEIPFGAVGFDCLSPLSAVRARDLSEFVLPGTRTGFTFTERYLDNLSLVELAGILDTGLGCSFISEARISGWSDITGAADGIRAVTKAKALQLPTGGPLRLHLGCDMEGMVGCSPANAKAYASDKGFCGPPEAGGFASQGYIGDSVPLTPEELYLLPFTAYWRSLSNVQQVAGCDYQMWQAFPTQTLHLPSGAFQVDVDFVCKDKRGRLPTMVVADDWTGA
jgi:hypothetical protein